MVKTVQYDNVILDLMIALSTVLYFLEYHDRNYYCIKIELAAQPCNEFMERRQIWLHTKSDIKSPCQRSGQQMIADVLAYDLNSISRSEVHKIDFSLFLKQNSFCY